MLDRNECRDALETLKVVSTGLNNHYFEEILKLEEMIMQNKYKVAVIGEFSSGKSTFLNAIAGKRILYSSAKEATGVVTFLENGQSKTATVIMDQGKMEQVSLDSKDGYEQLKDYLDIRNDKNSVTSVGINYPLHGIDKDIIFMDTPGLQGISERQMEVTRDILKEANATIMVITKKGFTQTELDLLTGNNKKFGTINTKEVFIVINKIGEIYEGKTEKEVVEKIEELKASVEERLGENGINNIKVFMLDSRDYLWSKDDDLYAQVKKGEVEDVKSYLSQEEYRNRSKFEFFKNFLFRFLEEGNRNIKFLEDINSKIYLLTEEFLSILSNRDRLRNENENQMLLRLNTQKTMLIENRRRLYNTLARYISNSFETFLSTLDEDVKALKKEKKTEIAKLVQTSLKSIEDLNDGMIDSLYNKRKESILRDYKHIEEKLNEYQEIMAGYLIYKKFNEEFMLVFNGKGSLKLDINTDKIKLDFNFEKIEYEENNILKLVREGIKETEKKINGLNQKIAEIKSKAPDFNISRLEQQKFEAQKEYDKEKLRLGSKPSPTQKYCYETRTRKKWIFFSESYEVKIPDGLDYSECKNWERKSKQISEKYLNNVSKIEEELEIYRTKMKNLKIYNKELDTCYERRIGLRQEEKDTLAYLQRKKEKDSQMFLASKKEQIFKVLELFEENSYKKLMDQVRNRIGSMNSEIKLKVKAGVEEFLKIYSEDLEKRIEQILVNASIDSGNLKEVCDRLNKLKEKIA